MQIPGHKKYERHRARIHQSEGLWSFHLEDWYSPQVLGVISGQLLLLSRNDARRLLRRRRVTRLCGHTHTHLVLGKDSTKMEGIVLEFIVLMTGHCWGFRLGGTDIYSSRSRIRVTRESFYCFHALLHASPLLPATFEASKSDHLCGLVP